MSAPVDLVSQVGGKLVRRVQTAINGSFAAPADADARSRWRSVTISCGPEEVMPKGRPPAPLAALGDLVEVQLRPAPGDTGTELAARLRFDDGTADQRQQVRSALRESKQLIEAGEVLRVDPTPHGQRSATPTGALVEVATRRAAGEGVL